MDKNGNIWVVSDNSFQVKRNAKCRQKKNDSSSGWWEEMGG